MKNTPAGGKKPNLLHNTCGVFGLEGMGWGGGCIVHLQRHQTAVFKGNNGIVVPLWYSPISFIHRNEQSVEPAR